MLVKTCSQIQPGDVILTPSNIECLCVDYCTFWNHEEGLLNPSPDWDVVLIQSQSSAPKE